MQIQKQKIIAFCVVVLAAVVFGWYGITTAKDGNGLAELSLNLAASIIAVPLTVSAVSKFIANNRITLKKFSLFFGETANYKNFKLVFCERKLSEEHCKLFTYPGSDRPLGMAISGKEIVPEGVTAWLAYDDMLVATQLGNLFGTIVPGLPLKVAVDSDRGGEWFKDSPTIAVGLGFTQHTRDLLANSGLQDCVSIVPTELDNTNLYTDKLHCKGPEIEVESGRDLALIVRRVKCNGPHVHFICAGRSAPGTAAAGRYLAECWKDLANIYKLNSKDYNSTSMAIIIDHPVKFKDVQMVDINNYKIRRIMFSDGTQIEST